jgi:hypothetical protein
MEISASLLYQHLANPVEDLCNTGQGLIVELCKIRVRFVIDQHCSVPPRISIKSVKSESNNRAVP